MYDTQEVSILTCMASGRSATMKLITLTSKSSHWSVLLNSRDPQSCQLIDALSKGTMLKTNTKCAFAFSNMYVFFIIYFKPHHFTIAQQQPFTYTFGC